MSNKKIMLILSSCCFFGLGDIGDLEAYTKKAPYEGFGKVSKTTKMVKTKIVNGHIKTTSKGVTHINPYARS